MDKHLFNNSFIRILLTIIVTLVLQLIAHMLIERVVRRVVSRHRFETKLDERKRENTLITVLRAAIGFFLWLVAILIILSNLGVNLAAAATGAGVFGVVIGLGAQSTIKDFLSGAFILFENQYRVGDIVSLTGGTTGALGTAGVVEEITLRITKLRDMEGTLNIIRNGDASIISNKTFQYSAVVVDVPITYESDIDLVEKVMNATGHKIAVSESYQAVVLEPITFLRVDSFTNAGVVVRAVGKVTPASQWEVAGAYRRELLKALSKNDISLALQQIVVHAQKPQK